MIQNTNNGKRWERPWGQKRRLKEESLRKLSKGAPEKLEIARRIRQETVMTHKWIAARLHMGEWKSMANKLSKTRTRH